MLHAGDFARLQLSEPLLRALVEENYVTATPIQARAIPAALEGRDVLGSAQTGTGKTAAFALPILHRLAVGQPVSAGKARCLVLSPTRELATQIAESFRVYGKFLKMRQTVIFGGVGQKPQVEALRRGVEIVIATPGRLLDLLEQRLCDLRGIEVLVLDEADRMLDMGFIRDVKKIVASLPAKRQTMMFSATMPAEIRSLASALLRNPVVVEAAPQSSTASGVEQSVYHVEKRNKPMLLAHLVRSLPMSRAIVFTRTKRGADKLVQHLNKTGIRAEAIHSNKSQNARQRALDSFKKDKIGLLVATDIASRGIDIDGITHVVNYDLTHEPETYVHRIGRTARAGATGAAIAFCDSEERSNLKAIEKLLNRRIDVRTDHPVYSASVAGRESGPDRERSSSQLPSRGEPGHGHRGKSGPSQHSQSSQPQHRSSQRGHGSAAPARPAAGVPRPSHTPGRGVQSPASVPAGRGRPQGRHPLTGMHRRSGGR